MAKNLSEEEIKDLKTTFNNINTDKSGTVTPEELKRGLTTLGSKVSETEVKQLIEAVSYHCSLLLFLYPYNYNQHMIRAFHPI